MKKVLSVALASAMVLGMGANAFAIQYSTGSNDEADWPSNFQFDGELFVTDKDGDIIEESTTELNDSESVDFEPGDVIWMPLYADDQYQWKNTWTEGTDAQDAVKSVKLDKSYFNLGQTASDPTLGGVENLTYDEAETVMNEIMSGQASPVQMSAYLTALSLKGETIDEVTASAAGMRKHCIRLLHDMDVLEIVGTGGDGSNSFNISTTSSLVISAAGVPVAKHGNRAASSRGGAADVLEALGVDITISPEKSAELLKKINLCFLFAQNYHIAMKYVAPIRKELEIRTVFNILGPLSNPAGANMELMGVFDETLVAPLAQVMMKLGVKRGMVVYGQDKLDEISMCAPTSVCEIRDGWFQSYELAPEQFGYERCQKEELQGGLPAENAAITREILNGNDRGPKRQAVCLNAGAALYIAGKTEDMEKGVRMAEGPIDSGAALRKLEEFIRESRAE